MPEPESPFEKAAESSNQSLGAELLAWLRHNRKWWLIPLIVTVALIGILTLLASTGAAPFLYTLW
jgi:hypothetical protein